MLRASEHLLIAIGLVALAWSASTMVEGSIAQTRALSALAAGRRSTRHITPARNVAHVNPPTAIERPRRGEPFAELEIPRLHVSEAVLEGSDDATLRRGPGHIEHTSASGESGNVGIAGHRDTFFRPLSEVQLGDDIVLSTVRGTFRYRVSSLRIVPPTDVGVLDAAEAPALTLITCYPFWYVGPAPMRYVVRAIRVGAT